MVNPFTFKYRIWFETKEKIFGIGVYDILEGVRLYGSLSESARRMNMSYSKAHKIVKKLEENLGTKMVNTQIGGSGGGSSELTHEALILMEKFNNFDSECQDALEDIFNKHFKDIVSPDKDV